MPFDPALKRFCLSHEGSFLVPAECLDARGLQPEFARLLVDERRISTAQLRCLADGFALYLERCADLFARAPGVWFAPRQTNLLVAQDARAVVPYLEPFAGTSSLLYVSDLDTHPEYVAVLLLHMERLSLMRSVRAAIISNLSYWFDRDAASRRAFADAAARARRPDADAFAALAEALAWIDDLLHDPLRSPAQAPDEPYLGVNDTGLYVPKRLQGALLQLAQRAEAALRAALQPHSAPAGGSASGPAIDSLCDWLERERAQVIVVAPDGSTAWTPQHADARTMRSALAGADAMAVASVHADLQVIDARTRRFLACVREPAALPTHCPVLEAGGGAYIDAARRAVVYELVQPAFDARASVAPPYHRLLLGARVIHEWGHVAHTAQMIAVPERRRAEHRAAKAHLGACFAEVVARMPGRLRDEIEQETRPLAQRAGDLPTALARKTMARVGDYLANLLGARLVPPEEMQAYVRANVRHHLDEQLGIVSEFARHAYEVHYLALAGLPLDYFFRTSRFPDHFLRTGLVREKDAMSLFDAAGAVLACYEFDESRLALPARAAA